MEEFNKRINKLNSNEEFQAYMSAEEENEMFYNTDMFLAREEGHASGLKEGHTSGLAEGQTEERIKVIKALMSKGFSPCDISKMIEISEEEICSLIN